jgi:hypothetical protein
MQDQTTAIKAALGVAWDELVGRRKEWTWPVYAMHTLAELRRRKVPIHGSTVREVLAIMVRDGMILGSEAEMLFLHYGEVRLSSEPALFDAFDEVDVERVVNRAFEEPAS